MIRLTQPSNAPNFCFEIVDVDDPALTVFIQADIDYLGVASTFGWTGPQQDLSAISDAFEYLCDNIGKVVEDPGYFT